MEPVGSTCRKGLGFNVAVTKFDLYLSLPVDLFSGSSSETARQCF